jgi:hypothetical protein
MKRVKLAIWVHDHIHSLDSWKAGSNSVEGRFFYTEDIKTLDLDGKGEFRVEKDIVSAYVSIDVNHLIYAKAGDSSAAKLGTSGEFPMGGYLFTLRETDVLHGTLMYRSYVQHRYGFVPEVFYRVFLNYGGEDLVKPLIQDMRNRHKTVLLLPDYGKHNREFHKFVTHTFPDIGFDKGAGETFVKDLKAGTYNELTLFNIAGLHLMQDNHVCHICGGMPGNVCDHRDLPITVDDIKTELTFSRSYRPFSPGEDNLNKFEHIHSAVNLDLVDMVTLTSTLFNKAKGFLGSWFN